MRLKKNLSWHPFLILLLLWMVAGKVWCAREQSEIFYTTQVKAVNSPEQLISLFKEGKLQRTSNSLNAGFTTQRAWLLIELSDSPDNEYVFIENAHLDSLELYFYNSADQLLKTLHAGDLLDFSARELPMNFFNFRVPAHTRYFLMKVKTEGPMLVPVKILSVGGFFDYAFHYGVFHWLYFGFIILIITSNVILLIWIRDSIYFYYLLCVTGMALMTSVDYGYSFQYLWPHHPEVNKYNTLFYLSSSFSLLFSEKLFKLKKELPKLYRIYQFIYLCFAILAVIGFIAPYDFTVLVYYYFLFGVTLFSIATSIFYYSYFKTSTARFYLVGWLSVTLSLIVYFIFLAGAIPYSTLLNNITQIGSGLQIILINIAILSNITSLEKEKEIIIAERNQYLEENIKAQDELIKAIMERERAIEGLGSNLENAFIYQLSEKKPKGYHLSYCSAGIGKILGNPLTDPVRNYFLFEEQILEEYKSLRIEQFKKGKNAFRGFEIEYRIKDMKDNIRTIQEKAFPKAQKNGEILWYGLVTDVSNQKLLEYHLLNERILTSTILNTTGGLVILLDTTGKVILFNKACERSSGYTFEEIKGKVLWDVLISAKDRTFVMSNFEVLRDGIHPKNQLENYWISKEGKARCIVWDNSTITNPEGEIEYILGTGIDITERKAVELSARKKEITLNSIINGILQSIWIIDQNANLVNYNRKFADNVRQVFNVDILPEHIGKPITHMFSENEINFWKPYYDRVLKGEHIHFERRYLQAGRIIEYDLYPIRLNNEETSIFVISNEITEKVRQQEELKLNEEKYRNLVEFSPIAILIYDIEDKRILEANEQASQLLQRTREDLLKMDIPQISPEYQENSKTSIAMMKEYIQSASNGKLTIFDWIHTDSSGKSIPTQVWLSRFPSKDRALLLATIVDITERKKNQEEQMALIEYQAALIDKIKEQEAGLSALINSTSDFIFSINRDLNLIEFNNAFKELVRKGSGTELKKGMNLKQLQIPQIRLIQERNAGTVFRGITVKDIIEMQANAGETSYFDFIFSPIFAENKEVIGATIIARDITYSKKAEKEFYEISKQMAEYKLMALRSVMNPHFLFNSLNSIQYFVAKNERRLALDYLSLFSSLIRQILNSSVNNTISLVTELEILNNYITLEKLRFDDKFDFVIETAPGLETDSIEIPSLLIQPYVENAILHGLMNKNGHGFLKISISKRGEFLIFSVEDNGVGRARAMEIKHASNVKEKSYGMLLTKERLDIINKTAEVSVTIEDLEDDQKQAAGTRVSISIRI